MEENILNLIENISIEMLVIAFLVFVLTMIIKFPIKKLTNKLEDNKRKAINSVIIMIPIALSILFNFAYLIISNSDLILLFRNSFNTWIMSISIYAIYERSLAIVKSISIGNKNEEQIRKNNEEITLIINKLDIDRKKLKEIKKRIDTLMNLKIDIEDLTTLFKTNEEIEKLKKEEKELEEIISKDSQKKNGIEGEENEF